MRRIPSILAFLLLATCAYADDAKKLESSVLYAGEPGEQRTRDWVTFLESHGATVRTIALGRLEERVVGDADVVIVDSPTPYKDGGGIELPRAPQLDLDFKKPTILMGAAGGAVLGHLGIKLNWL